MKKSVAMMFLLLVFMILPMSYSPSTILAEPNMSKDFQLSEDWSASEQSITSFAEEIGWIHDCSNTTGITNTTVGDTVSSDGDLITLTSDVAGAYHSYEIAVGGISTSTYPFLVLNCTSISEGDGWKLEMLDTPGGSWSVLQSTYVLSAGVYRYNMKALDTQIETLRLNVTQTATIKFDFFKAYGIENFTITQGNCEADDLLYINDSNQIVSIISATNEYITINYDVSINIAAPPYILFNLTLADIDPTAGRDYEFIYRTTLSGGTKTFTQDSYQGESPYGGDWTDCGLNFWGSGSVILSAIKFLGILPQWREIGTANLYFAVGIDPAALWALNNLYILLGAGLVIGCGVYLVKGGKNDLSMNKFYFVIVAFMIGWALIIGGVMP